jgi:Tfp pilus assembly protein PilF
MSELRSRFHTPSQLQEFASHHISLALALMQVGQSSPAAEHLRQSFAISDVSPDARAIAGDLAWQMGDSNEAIEHFERALQLRPQWPDVQTQLERIRQNLQVQYRSAL